MRNKLSGYKSRRLSAAIGVMMLFSLPLMGHGPEAAGPVFWDFLLRSRLWMAAVFSIIGLIMLNRGWVTRKVRAAALLVIAFVFGVLYVLPLGSFASGLAPHPSPVCLVTRPYQFLLAGRAVPLLFMALISVMILLNLLGNKLFCGWVCPVGALQELTNLIPLPRKWKIVIPFRFSNSVRILFFLAFFVFLFSSGVMIYEYISPFEFFHFGFEGLAIAALAVALLLSLFIFRPFCYFLCPLGLITWVVEQTALFRVRLRKGTCRDCRTCVSTTYCPAVQAILDGCEARPDCFACGRCMELCPDGDLRFKLPGKKQSGKSKPADGA